MHTDDKDLVIELLCQELRVVRGELFVAKQAQELGTKIIEAFKDPVPKTNVPIKALDVIDHEFDFDRESVLLIQLTKAEAQSGSHRLDHAESLIRQLPLDHDGRNTWLMNCGVSKEARELRSKHYSQIPEPNYIVRKPRVKI